MGRAAHTGLPRNFAVLVVEDEPLLLEDAVDFLEDAGFTVYRARSAAQAVEQLEKHADIRVLFTDVDMPGSMDGLALAKAVRDRWPPVHILITSGHIELRKEDMPDRGIFFSKPYTSAAVIHEIDRFTGAR
ncbi:MAG: response regulator [Methylobacterium mesophilicum]|nr:response regulator [Methylobacterium mesophilicum]